VKLKETVVGESVGDGASCLGTWHQGPILHVGRPGNNVRASRLGSKVRQELACAGNHEENQQSISDVDI
jgi:hypothetical protein